MLPAPKRVEDVVLVVNENEDAAAGAKASVNDTAVKAKIDPDRIFIVAFVFLFSNMQRYEGCRGYNND